MDCFQADCRVGEWKCLNGQQCIPERFRCDKNYHCSDLSDETSCPSPGVDPEPELKLRTYPTEQTIEEGREVVFQCRDEGPLRAEVKWRREGLPLPAGARDENGRLEIPSIAVRKYIPNFTSIVNQLYSAFTHRNLHLRGCRLQE